MWLVPSPFLCLLPGGLSHGGGVQFADEVRAVHASEGVGDALSFFGFVPEEEHALCQFLLWSLGREDGLQGVGVQAGVPGFGADSHGGGSEVLHLLQVEVHLSGEDSQFGHVLFGASRM